MNPWLAAAAGSALTGVTTLFVGLAREAWRNRQTDRQTLSAIRRITAEYPPVRRPASPEPPPWQVINRLEDIPRPAPTWRGVASVPGDYLEPQIIDPPTGRHHPGAVRQILAEAAEAYTRTRLYGRFVAPALDTKAADEPLWLDGNRDLPVHHARGAR